MKKLFAFLMSAAMLFCVFALTGCKDGGLSSGGNTNDLYTLVSQGIKKTQEVTSYSAVIKQSATMSLMGTVTDFTTNFNIAANMADPKKPIISMNGSMSTAGQEFPAAYYFDGSWMYTAINGEGYKMEVPLSQFEQSTVNVDEIMVDLPAELFEGVTPTVENGVTKIELTGAGDVIKNIFNDEIKDLYADVLGDDISAVTVDDVKIVITLSSDYVMGYEMSFKCSYVIGSDSLVVDFTQSVIFESINEDVTITPPEGYESFPEISAG